MHAAHLEVASHRPCDCQSSCTATRDVLSLQIAAYLQAYLRQSRQAMSRRGGIFVMDLLGGHAAEESVLMHRHNDSTGASFVWEQEGFNPVTRHIHAYITLKDPDTKKVLHACGSLSCCRAGYVKVVGSPWHFEPRCSLQTSYALMHVYTVEGVPASNRIASSNIPLKQTKTFAADPEESLPISLEVVDHPGAA